MIILSENFRALFYAPFYAAHAIGAYEAEGVTVTLRPSADPARASSDLRSGAIDVMWGGPLRVLLTHAADPAADLVCFCDAVARDPFFIVGREPRPNFRPRDLLGVRFASVSEVPTPWICLRDDIERDGADPAAIDRLHGPTMAENAAALRAGALDAIQVFQPYAESLVVNGSCSIWYAAADRGLTAYTTLVTRRSLLRDRHDELAAMVRGMDRALRWIATTPGFEAAQTLRPWFPDVPVEIFAAALDRYRALGLYATTPVIRRDGVERLHTAMRSAGALDKDIPFETIVDNSLAEAAVSSAPDRG